MHRFKLGSRKGPEGCDKFSGVLKALRRILRQGALDGVVNGDGEIGSILQDGAGVAAEDRIEDRIRGVAEEWQAAAEHLVEDDPAGPEIGAVV